MFYMQSMSGEGIFALPPLPLGEGWGEGTSCNTSTNMIRFQHFLAFLFFAALISGVIAAGWFFKAIRTTGPFATERIVYIEPGSPVRVVSAKLIESNIIGNDVAFILDAKLQCFIGKKWGGGCRELKAGEYQFHPGMSIQDVIALLQSGKTYQHSITLPEGLMTVEIIDLLQKEPALDGTISTLPPEGSLLPETYHFSRGDTRQDILNRMNKSMADEIGDLWEKRDPAVPLKTPEEAVVLASVVEKETGLAAERPRVAGVFVNRLNRNIPLQSDPTVIYAVTLGHAKLDRSLTYKDLKMASPYNTYVTPGLPPTPIANPGKASLEAVLHPEKNDYIYFVADGSGGHAFSRTLAEHNANVEHWRKIEKTPN